MASMYWRVRSCRYPWDGESSTDVAGFGRPVRGALLAAAREPVEIHSSVPGEGSAGATVDSRERFYGALFLGYGLAWIWAARQSPIPSTLVRWLAGISLLGGVGRLLSMAVHGSPQWFQIVLTLLELALPPLYFWLSAADQRTAARPPVRRAGPARP
ncbi:DUF4345 domain-containing protein [Streptomyces sp. NPDC048434]|uniref:DUF4345 domain-containing protein n=1 Tax=Streptomyces sp. NPDC048434 TaxID=3365549 RepID=UPI00371E724E